MRRARTLTRSLAAQDPEGILKPPEPGHINRRMYFKKVANDQAFLEQVRRARAHASSAPSDGHGALSRGRASALWCFHVLTLT